VNCVVAAMVLRRLLHFGDLREHHFNVSIGTVR
jgi:hypothetical protein